MYCEYCGRVIHEGDTYYDIDDHPVCIDHVLDYLDENCKDVDDDGEEIYVVDDTGYDLDDVANLLKWRMRTCEEPEEVDDPRYEPEYWEERNVR